MKSITLHLPMRNYLPEKTVILYLEYFMHTLLGLQYYSTNSLLYLGIIQDKYISLYRELITQLCTYVSAIRILAKGYLPNTLIKREKLQEILDELKNSVHITNPDYNLVLDRLHLYYDMQLITFGIEKDMNIIIQFPVLIQPYTQKPLILYQPGYSSCSNFGQEHKGSIIHTLVSQETLYCLKFRNLYFFETA